MLHPAEKFLPLKIIFYIISFLLLYILLPVFFVRTTHTSGIFLLLFYLINAFVIFYLLKKTSNKKYYLDYQIQGLQEKMNILEAENIKEGKNSVDLEAKIKRYNSLKDIIEEINKNLDLDSVTNSITALTFSIISNNKGACILYLIDKHLNLQIFKTKREDKNLIIKAKEGDIFDLWVLRHSSPLLIEDVKKDFRFDLEKLKIPEERPISSLISSPLMSEHRFLGTLRLDHQRPYFFTQDDLRFLVTICDLGAMALENSELFLRTQELAIRDGLTSLYTKGHFLERLKEECKRSIHYHMVFSLLMIDIDFFKDYNDKFGHTAGDIVLKNLGQNLLNSLKDLNSIVSRFGGEEFCIILPHLDKKNAYTIANSLREKIEKEKIVLRRQETNITVSIGIATFPQDTVLEDELIQKADKAMYEAKRRGRNQVCSI